MRTKALLFWILAISTGFTGCKSKGTIDTADALLDSFGASCRTNYSTWSSATLAQTESLKSTLEIMKASQDSACAAATGLLASVETLSSQISRLTYDSTMQEYLALKQQQADLQSHIADLNDSITELSSSTDPDDISLLAEYTSLVSTLQTTYLSNEATRITLESTIESNAAISSNSNTTAGLTYLGTYAQDLLASAESLQQCYSAAPYMAYQLAGSLLALSGSFVTKELAATFSLVGNFITSGVDAIRRAKLQSKILRLESTKLQAALPCAMEAMADLYCDAESTYRLLGLATRSANQDQWKPVGVWKALDLINERLPVLVSWLQEVRGGVEPPNSSAASYINGFWDLLFGIQKARVTVQGIFQETSTFLNGQSDWTKREKLLRSAISSSVTSITSSASSYFSDTSNTEVVCRLVQSESDFNKYCCRYFNENDDPTHQNPLWYDATTCLNNMTIKDELDNFKGRSIDTLDELESFAYDLIRKVSNQDVARLAHAAKESSLSNYSPLRVLTEMAAYLHELEGGIAPTPGPSNAPAATNPGLERSRRDLIRETREAIEAVVTALTDDQLSPEKKIAEVYSRFQLKTGTQWLNDRIKDLVKWDVEDRIKNGEVGEDVQADLQASGMTIYENLASAGLSLSQLQPIKDDLDNGLSTTQQNLAVFMDTFAPHIEKALVQLRDAADQAGEPLLPAPGARRPNRARLARVCTLVATTVAEWPQKISRKLCKDAVLESVFDEAPLSLSFSEIESWSKDKPLNKRICVYSNFYRAARLYTVDNGEKLIHLLKSAPRGHATAPKSQ